MRLADLRLEEEGSVLCAHLSGDIDMSNASEIREELTAATPNAALGLILDLSGVDYMDSAGIHLIHRLRDSLGARGQKLRLVIPENSLILDTLRLAGVDWGQEIVDSIPSARASIQGA